jgi:predicted secreted protein
MGIVEIIIAYVVSWWLLLFMVLPFGAAPENTPKEGHAVSAPAQPNLRKKALITSLLALGPTLLLYCLYD